MCICAGSTDPSTQTLPMGKGLCSGRIVPLGQRPYTGCRPEGGTKGTEELYKESVMVKRKTRRHRSLTVLLSVCFLVLALVTAGCGAGQDVALARRVLTLLVKGQYAARHLIDWEKLVVLNRPIGRQWSGYEGEDDRLKYQRSFIDSFGMSFKEQGGSVKNFINWRVLETFKEPVRMTRVAADLKGNPSTYFIFDIEHVKGKKKLVRIEALLITDEEAFREYEEKAPKN